MNKYKVTGFYTISFEMEVEAENREEAEEMGVELDLQTEWNGNSVFVRDQDIDLNADGTPFGIEVELLEGDPVTIQCYDIEWDTDNEECDLPTSVELVLENTDDIREYHESKENYDVGDFLANKLSNEYGFCVNNFKYEED